jgi:hypothetical protein
LGGERLVTRRRPGSALDMLEAVLREPVGVLCFQQSAGNSTERKRSGDGRLASAKLLPSDPRW